MRLYLRFYLALLGSLVAFALLLLLVLNHPVNHEAHLREEPIHAVVLFLTLVGTAVAIGAYPIARRLTTRLERLQRGVESLGAGDLSARVPVEGKDEVAGLAASFNRSAERIERLVASHRSLLADTSHELRTPLTRIRLAVELMKDSAEPRRKADLERDLAELDQLIDEILLHSRLDAVSGLEQVEDIDLLALAAEEGARYPRSRLEGEPATLRGDPRLLRRVIRNLLENSERHGAPPTDLRVALRGDLVELTCADHGPGVPAPQRERVFEPFYRGAGEGERGGAGLGLALVRQIARRHGGDARCIGLDDGRTAFVVTLPVAGPAAADVARG